MVSSSAKAISNTMASASHFNKVATICKKLITTNRVSRDSTINSGSGCLRSVWSGRHYARASGGQGSPKNQKQGDSGIKLNHYLNHDRTQLYN